MRHQLDRALFEMDREGESGEAEGGMYEVHEAELASELLEISSEQELDRFLGKLLSTAVGAGKAFLSSDAGKAVGGMLKGAAKQALPQIGRAVGDFISPGGAGADVGGQLATAAGSRLGLELEGLSAEDRELEAARAFVRFADETARIAEVAPPSVPPTTAAAHAATVAAQHQLPGIAPLVRQLRPPGNGGQQHFGPHSAGRWARRGPTIVLFG